MGIIKNIAKSAAIKTIKKVSTFGVYAAGSIAYQLSQQKAKEDNTDFLTEETSHSRLIILQEQYKYKESMQILDSSECVKYIVKGKALSTTHQLSLYDKAKSNKLGAVKEKLIAFRSPLSLESKPQDFIIEVDGKKIGKIKSRSAFGKRKFEFDFNGWTIVGDVLGMKYKVMNGKNPIMTIESKLLRDEKTYYVDIFNKKHELICVLIALAIDSSKSSKANDNARAYKHTKIKYTGFDF